MVIKKAAVWAGLQNKKLPARILAGEFKL